MQTLQDLVQQLQSHPNVIGLVEYGSRSYTDIDVGGDYDLLVLLKGYTPPVESLHFYLKDLPVDINLHSFEAWQQGRLSTPLDTTLIYGRLIYEAVPAVSSLLSRLQRDHPLEPDLSEYLAPLRYGQTHSLDKLTGRLETMPTFSRYLLYSNLYWLIQHYFSVRGLPFKGEKHAFAYLDEHTPDILERLEAIYAERDLARQVELTRALNESVLEPVGGLWQAGEVLTFGNNDNLQETGQEVYRFLFETPAR